MRNRLCASAAWRGRPAFTAATGLVLAALSGGCSTTDPAASGARWRASHPHTDDSIVRGVNWPGTTVRRVESDAHGFRTVLKFSGDDSDMGAIAEVVSADTDPCATLPYLITDTGTVHPDPSTYGDTASRRPVCTLLGDNAWKLEFEPATAGDFYGYAERRDGVLVILSTSDDWTNPNFKAIAASLHPLSEEQLGSML